MIVSALGAAASLLARGRDDARLDPAARLAADSARRDLDQAWQPALRSLEARAVQAAAMRPLQSALNDGADAGALAALFQTADWWRPLRDELEIVRVISGSQILLEHRTVDLGTADRDLVAAARIDRVASSVLIVDGRPFLVAAARISALPSAAPVLLLGILLDAGMIEDLSRRTQQAVMLSHLGSPVEMAGTAEQRGEVRPLAGLETETTAIDPQGRWVAAAITVGPSVRLWTLRPWATQEASFIGFGGANSPALARISPPIFLALGLLLLFGARRRGTTGGAADKAPSVSRLPSPSTIGRYTLRERLGQGGMADIYLSTAHGDEGFTRTFVLKRLRPELAHNKEAVSQFIDEARMQAGLVHSNIVPVFDFGVVDSEYFMTQEYIRGRDLGRVAQRCLERLGRLLEPRVVFYIAQEILLALDYAHSKRDREGRPHGIVHRDVSTGNIMISLEGEVKLFDFGIVKANHRHTQTQIGSVKGNARFMSPEQARGQNVDHRGDLFSLGLVMYYCLAGQFLYDGNNDFEILHKAATGPTEEDWERIGLLSGPAPELLTRALAYHPDDRFQSATEFAQRLAPHVNQIKSEASSLMQVLFGDELRHEAA